VSLLAYKTAILLCCVVSPFAAELQRNKLLEYRAGTEVRPVQNVEEWRKRRSQILAGMQEVMGKLPGAGKRSPLEAKVESSEDCGEFTRQFVTYSAEPGERVPAYLLLPKNLTPGKKVPGALTLHQTHKLGHKVVVGLGDSPDDEYGVELVKRGFVCLAPAYPQLADYWPDLKRLGWESGTMKAIWNNMRGVDLLSELPYVDTNAFVAIGHSLGGHNSLYTAAFDERIKVVVTSCGFDSFIDYMDGNIKGWTSDRYMPRLLNYPDKNYPFDFYEVLGAIAPRAVFINAPKRDSNFKWRSVEKIVGEAGKVYELHQAATNLAARYPDAEHSFPAELRKESFGFIESRLGK
jgi:dienelactone hydrolase